MIIEKIYEVKKKKIKGSPCHTNRASQMGDPCTRRLVYERTNHKDKTLHDIGLQLIFEEGELQEKKVIQDLVEAGFDVYEQQRGFSWKAYQISAHLDLKINLGGTAYPIEIKSMNPHIFDAIHTIKDFDKYPWTKKYPAQLTLYLLLSDEEKGYFILKNKSSGALKEIEFKLDWEYAESLIQKAEAINKHIEEGTLPDKINEYETCSICPFAHICGPDLDFGKGVEIKESAELLEMLVEREGMMESWRDYNRIDKQLKERLKQVDKVLIGKFLITGKWVEKKEFTVNAQKYWKTQILDTTKKL